MHYRISPIQSNFFDTSSCIFNFSKFPAKKIRNKKILATYWAPLGPTGPTFSMYSSASVHFWVTSGRRSSNDFFSRSSASACFTCCSAWVKRERVMAAKIWKKIWTKAGILVEKSWGTQIIWTISFLKEAVCICVLLCRAILRNEKSRVWQCQRLLRTKKFSRSFNDDHFKFPNFNGFLMFFSSQTPSKTAFFDRFFVPCLRPGCAILVHEAGEAPLCHPGMGCSLLMSGSSWIFVDTRLQESTKTTFTKSSESVILIDFNEKTHLSKMMPILTAVWSVDSKYAFQPFQALALADSPAEQSFAPPRPAVHAVLLPTSFEPGQRSEL